MSHKAAILPVARRLVGCGFTLLATQGTATFLESHGLTVQTVKKVQHGSPNVVDALRRAQVLEAVHAQVMTIPIYVFAAFSNLATAFFSDRIKHRYSFIIIGCIVSIIGYATFYLVRKNLPMAMPSLGRDLHISKSDLGLFLTLHGVLYGVAKFANGFFGDRCNARSFFIVGLAGSALLNLLFGFGSTVAFFGIVWMLNGWFQGMGFPPCARLLTHWFPPKQLATKMSIWNTSHCIGAIVILLLGAALVVDPVLPPGQALQPFGAQGVVRQLVGDLLLARLPLDDLPQRAEAGPQQGGRAGAVFRARRPVPGELVDDRDQHFLEQLLLGVEAVVHAGQAGAGLRRDGPGRRRGHPVARRHPHGRLDELLAPDLGLYPRHLAATSAAVAALHSTRDRPCVLPRPRVPPPDCRGDGQLTTKVGQLTQTVDSEAGVRSL